MYKKSDIMYKINQNKSIKINNDINIEFVNKNIEKSKKNHKNEYQNINMECYSIYISTKTQDIKFLQDFTDKIYSEYIDFKNYCSLNKKYIFTYKGLDKKNREIWSEIPWSTNKTYDNIFIENKSEIIDNIHKLANQKEFNKRIGRPNHTNILIWGEDFGCGKTSLLKVICNVEFPDRHNININLSKIKKQ